MASKLPPGPNYPGLLATMKFQRQLAALLDSARARYGDVWTLRVIGATFVMVSEPELVEGVFKADPTVLHGAATVAEPILGPQSVLLASEGEHAALRSLMQPLFHGERVQRLPRRHGEHLRGGAGRVAAERADAAAAAAA